MQRTNRWLADTGNRGGEEMGKGVQKVRKS